MFVIPIPGSAEFEENGRRHAERYASRVGNPFAFSRKFSVKNCVNSAANAKKKKRPRAGRFRGSGK
jgi:hypothetical protein